MQATEPPKVEAGERTERRSAHPSATAADGSWRTLIQRWENGQWITHSEYPGDWAWQWERVAADERRRADRYVSIARVARNELDDIR
jgi:hypothetical protein